MGDFLLQGNVSLCEEDNLGWGVCVCVCVCACVEEVGEVVVG